MIVDIISFGVILLLTFFAADGLLLVKYNEETEKLEVDHARFEWTYRIYRGLAQFAR